MDSVSLLNRLLAIHGRSLASYLVHAAPWVRGSQHEAAEALRAIAAEQEATCEKVGKMIVDAGGRLEPGEYPMLYAGYHDLSLDFLLNKLIERQQADNEVIQSVGSQADEGSDVRTVAEEALGAAKGYLETLRELSSGVSA